MKTTMLILVITCENIDQIEKMGLSCCRVHECRQGSLGRISVGLPLGRRLIESDLWYWDDLLIGIRDSDDHICRGTMLLIG